MVEHTQGQTTKYVFVSLNPTSFPYSPTAAVWNVILKVCRGLIQLETMVWKDSAEMNWAPTDF